MNGFIFLSLSVLFWALNFHLGKIMLSYVSPNIAAFLRFLIGVTGLLLLSYRILPPWKELRKNLGGILLVGFVGVFGFIFFFTQGLNGTSEINGALFIALSPAVTLVLAAIFLDHHIKAREVIGILLAFLGVVFLLTKGDILALRSLSFNRGDLFFIIATIFFSLQNIWIRKYAPRTNGRAFTLATNLCCLIGFILLLPIEGPVNWTDLPNEFWIAALGMGLPGTALAYYCWNQGIKLLGPAKGPIFLNGIPIMVAILAVPFGAELHWFHLVSLTMILAGLLIIQTKRKVS